MTRKTIGLVDDMINQKTLIDKQKLGKKLEHIEPYVLNEQHLRRLEVSVAGLKTRMFAKYATEVKDMPLKPSSSVKKDAPATDDICDMV